MKTIRQYLEELPDEIRESALQNAHVELDTSEEGIENVASALESAFVWSSSPQGHNYWYNIYKSLLKNDNNGQVD